MSSAEGGSVQAKLHARPRSISSARRRRDGGTSRMLTPLRPARPVRPLRCCSDFGIVRQIGVDDETEIGQIDAARRDVGGDANPRAPVAQRLQRLVALVLAQFARQRHGGEAALAQHRFQMAHRLARVAEHQRGRRIHEAQQIDDGAVRPCCGAMRMARYSMSAWPRAVARRLRCAARRAGNRCARVDDAPWAGWRRTAACAASAGVVSRMNSRSSRKPRSSISSASSSTTALSADDLAARARSRWSRRRPGVPTTICTPSLQAGAARGRDPCRRRRRRRARRHSDRASSVRAAPACASSRVGAMISASGSPAGRSVSAPSEQRLAPSPGHRRRSCRSRSAPRPADRGPRPRARARRPEPASPPYSRARQARERSGQALSKMPRGTFAVRVC